MPISSEDIRFLSNKFIPRRGNNAFFSGNLSTGTDLVINFDLVKCITKINIRHQQDVLPWCIQQTLK